MADSVTHLWPVILNMFQKVHTFDGPKFSLLDGLSIFMFSGEELAVSVVKE